MNCSLITHTNRSSIRSLVGICANRSFNCSPVSFTSRSTNCSLVSLTDRSSIRSLAPRYPVILTNRYSNCSLVDLTNRSSQLLARGITEVHWDFQFFFFFLLFFLLFFARKYQSLQRVFSYLYRLILWLFFIVTQTPTRRQQNHPSSPRRYL